MAHFQFTSRSSNPENLMAMLPMQLSIGARSADAVGMIDSAASSNVIPYTLGAALGAIWKEQQMLGNLSGALSRVEINSLVVQGNSH